MVIKALISEVSDYNGFDASYFENLTSDEQ
jgi:hypothetical protein